LFKERNKGSEIKMDENRNDLMKKKYIKIIIKELFN